MRIIKVLTATVAAATVIGGVPAAHAAVPVMKKPSPTFTTTIKEGRKAVRQALKQTKSTSASIALVSNGKTVWSQTFGRVNPAGEKPSATTRYGIGSVSKVLTAMAVMKLVDQGKISLDAPVARYVPDFSMRSPQYKQITVRMLLNHSAGLPGADLAGLTSYKPIPSYVEGVLDGLANSHLKTTPGAMNVYCNDCFSLAGVVVERVSGMPLQDYVTSNILKPLRMNHSNYQTSVPAPGTVAPVIEGGKVQPIEIMNAFATGGLVSTSDDMAQLAKVFTGDGVVAGKRILSSSAIRQMSLDQTTTTLRVGHPGIIRYGLGWDNVQDPALKSAGVLGWTKNGATGDYHAAFVIAPDQGLAVVVEGAGKSFGDPTPIAQTVLLNALVETGAVKKMPKQVSGKPSKQKATPRDIKRMTGFFLTLGLQMKVTEAKKRSLKTAQLTENGKWVNDPGRFELRKDGAFWSTRTPGDSIRSVKAWGRTYLVKRSIGGTGTYYSRPGCGSADPFGGFVVAGLAGPGGQEVVDGQRGPELAVVDPVWHSRRGSRDHPRVVRLPAGLWPARPSRSLRRHDQRHRRHHVPADSPGVGSGPVRLRLLHAGWGGVPVVQQQCSAARGERSRPVVGQQRGHHRCERLRPVVPNPQCCESDTLRPERLETVRRHVVHARQRRGSYGDETGAGWCLPGRLRSCGQCGDCGRGVGRVGTCPQNRGLGSQHGVAVQGLGPRSNGKHEREARPEVWCFTT